MEILPHLFIAISLPTNNQGLRKRKEENAVGIRRWCMAGILSCNSVLRDLPGVPFGPSRAKVQFVPLPYLFLLLLIVCFGEGGIREEFFLRYFIQYRLVQVGVCRCWNSL
ncbi:hypothetical protein TNCV_947991 [Trichonephila clavipes]|nr:hypothetical protein TNCV_947991 [Trichonephila clavipes]